MVNDCQCDEDVGCDEAAAAAVTPTANATSRAGGPALALLAGPTLQTTTALLAISIFAETAWADIAPPPLIKRLDDATRAKVLAALAGLIILGFAMVWLTWLGARVVQRYRQGTPFHRPTPRPGEHDWAKRPLAGSEPDSPAGDP